MKKVKLFESFVNEANVNPRGFAEMFSDTVAVIEWKNNREKLSTENLLYMLARAWAEVSDQNNHRYYAENLRFAFEEFKIKTDDKFMNADLREEAEHFGSQAYGETAYHLEGMVDCFCHVLEDLGLVKKPLVNKIRKYLLDVDESVVTEGKVSYPKGKQYRVSARFTDKDDQNTFAETYDLGRQSSNYSRVFANEEELVEIVKDLKNVYGLTSKDITLHIKGKNGDYDFWKIDSQNLKRHLSSDLLSKLQTESVANESQKLADDVSNALNVLNNLAAVLYDSKDKRHKIIGKSIEAIEEIISKREMINLNEAMSFQDLVNTYKDNPYGIGANSIEYVESENWGNQLILRFEDNYSRKETEAELKKMGIKAKKMSKSTADKAFKYRYELTVFESKVNEEYIELAGFDQYTSDLIEEFKSWYDATRSNWEDFKDDMAEDSVDEAAKNAQMEILAYLSNEMNNIIKDRKFKVRADFK